MGAEKGELEFVHDLAALIPSQVFGELMGIPQEDRAQINRWAEMMTGGQDPDLNPDGYTNATRQRGLGRDGDVRHAVRARRGAATTASRATSAICCSRPRSTASPWTTCEFAYFFVQVVTAGNDTTRTMISSGLLELARSTRSSWRSSAAIRSLAASAVEEVLRYAPPLHYFRRTSTADAEVRGQPIAAGEKIAMMYTSANRDEDVFAEPDTLRRPAPPEPAPRRSASASTSASACTSPGSRGGSSSRSCSPRGAAIELTGEPQRQRSNLNNALKSLPIRVARRLSATFPRDDG